MKKRVVSGLLVLSMVATSIVGCGASDSGKEGDENDKFHVSANTLFGDEETYTLKVPYIGVSGEPEDLDRIEDKVSEYLKSKINCEIEFSYLGINDQSSKYNMWLSSGEPMDIMYTVFTDYTSMINAGSFLEMDDLLEEYGQDILKKNEELGFAESGKYNGVQYGLPTIPASPGNGGSLLIRQDVYDSLDLSNIKEEDYISYEELDDIFSQIKEKYPEYIPLGICGAVADSFYFYLKNYDDLGVSGGSCGVLMDPINDTTIENLFATDEYYEYLTWMRKWYEDGYIMKDAATNTDTPEILLKAGRTASGITMSTPGMCEATSFRTGIEFKELELCPPYATTRVYTGVMFFIPQTCEKPERAMAFLNLLFSDKTLINLLLNGEEGVDYEFKEGSDVVVELKPDRKYTAEVGAWGDQGMAYIQAPQTEEILSAREEYTKKAVENTSLANGYQFDMTSVSMQQAAVSNVINQYLAQLEYGTVDLDKVYPEFLKALEDAGINDIIEENQKQLNEWLKNKE